MLYEEWLCSHCGCQLHSWIWFCTVMGMAYSSVELSSGTKCLRLVYRIRDRAFYRLIRKTFRKLKNKNKIDTQNLSAINERVALVLCKLWISLKVYAILSSPNPILNFGEDGLIENLTIHLWYKWSCTLALCTIIHSVCGLKLEG